MAVTSVLFQIYDHLKYSLFARYIFFSSMQITFEIVHTRVSTHTSIHNANAYEVSSDICKYFKFYRHI